MPGNTQRRPLLSSIQCGSQLPGGYAWLQCICAFISWDREEEVDSLVASYPCLKAQGREEGWIDGPSGCIQKGRLAGCLGRPVEAKGSQAAHSSTGAAAICTTAVKATPGVQAKQTGLVMFGESNICKASCLSELCVLLPLAELAKGMEPPGTRDTLQLCTAPGAGALGASLSVQVAASAPSSEGFWPACHIPSAQGSTPSSRAGCASSTGLMKSTSLHCSVSPAVLQGCQKCSQCWSLSQIPSAS